MRFVIRKVLIITLSILVAVVCSQLGAGLFHAIVMYLITRVVCSLLWRIN